MATIQVGQSTFNMPAGSYAINPGSVFQTYNPSSGQTTYGSAPAGFVSGATAGNYAAVQTPQNLPSTAQVYQGDKLGYQPYSAATAFNETKPGVFASQYSQGQVPQVKPLEIPGMISVAQAEKAPTEVAKEVSKSTPTGQQIRTLEELKLYKESDLARTTGNEVYRRDVAKEQAALKEYGARYGSMPKTPEDWKKLNDIAYKGNTASNGLPVNGQVTDADGSVITTDEMGIPNAAESTTFMGQLNAIMAEITATRNELAKQEEDLAQYQEDTAMGVQDIGEQLGRSASLIGGDQGALQQRRATKENTLAKKAEILQNKLTGLNQDKQFIWQQAQQMSQNAQSNLALILNSMKGGTTTWSEMPVSQRTALENLASMAGVPSGLLSASVDAMANTTKLEAASSGVTGDWKNYELAGGQAGTGQSFQEWLGKSADGTEQSAYQIERATRTIQSVDELMGQVNGNTAGWGAFFMGKLPGTEARYFKGQLDTLKANITFGELTAMREASKTGGALGQVSDREGQLLGAALGSLDQLQSPAQLTAQLTKIKESIQRWQDSFGASDSEYSW